MIPVLTSVAANVKSARSKKNVSGLIYLKVAFKNINLQSLAHKQILGMIKYNSVTCDISHRQILITLFKLLFFFF